MDERGTLCGIMFHMDVTFTEVYRINKGGSYYKEELYKIGVYRQNKLSY